MASFNGWSKEKLADNNDVHEMRYACASGRPVRMWYHDGVVYRLWPQAGDKTLSNLWWRLYAEDSKLG